MCYSVTTHIFLSSYFHVFIFNWFGVPLEGKRGGGDTKRSSYILTIYPESMGYILGKPLKNFQTLDIVRRGGGGQWYRRTFYQGGGEGGEGLIIEKKQVNFKVHFGLFKAFLDHVFFFH